MEIPAALRDRPFTRAEALDAGLTAKQLRSHRFRTLFRGVYADAQLPVTLPLRAQAALLIAPPDAVLSHETALALWGLEVPGRRPIHVSTNTGWHSRQRGIVSHRRQAAIARRRHHGLPVTSPRRTFVDVALTISWVWLVAAGDWLLHRELVTLEHLASYVEERHLSGVQRARRTLQWVREGVESPMETMVRLMLIFARLPEPQCNVDVLDHDGRFVARVDLAFVAWRVAVEYDGRWHERSAHQRVRDRNRREALERLGWRMVVFYDTDLRTPEQVPWRVFEALRDQGFLGPPPQPSAMWTSWFSSRNLWPPLAQSQAGKGPQVAKSCPGGVSGGE